MDQYQSHAVDLNTFFSVGSSKHQLMAYLSFLLFTISYKGANSYVCDNRDRNKVS